MGGGDRRGEHERGQVQDRGAGDLGGEAVGRGEREDAPAERAHDPQPTGIGSGGEREGASQDHPERHAVVLLVTGDHQAEDDDAHALLRVLQSVAEGEAGRGEDLGPAHAARDPVGVGRAEQPVHRGHDQVAEDEPDRGRDHHGQHDLAQHALPLHGGGRGQRRADQAADQRVRGG